MPPPKDPEKLKLWRERQSIAAKKRIAREVAQRISLGEPPFPHLTKAAEIRWADPTSRTRQSESQRIAQNTPENKAFRKRSLKERWDNQEEREKLLESRKGMFTPELCESRKNNAIRCWSDPGWVERNIESRKKTYANPDYKERISDILKEKFKDPSLLQRMRDITTKRYEDPSEREKVTERLLRGFWYGNIRYPEKTVYCEKWTRDFRNRCRAWDNYKSVLSGITKERNLVKGKPVELSVHHVYYQKKACCEWDEDINGYYVMINLGTRAKPNMVRYDIKGDPNKFVTLSHAENAMVNYDKLKWIKIFEDMIESRGGKCYYTKEEMKKLGKD